jgi:predicted alpha/beta-hydrolase family hydrolase
MAKLNELRFQVEGGAEVSALLNRPTGARRILVLAHGAGAGMNHPFMEDL